jgi:hypothetical protein
MIPASAHRQAEWCDSWHKISGGWSAEPQLPLIATAPATIAPSTMTEDLRIIPLRFGKVSDDQRRDTGDIVGVEKRDRGLDRLIGHHSQ